MKKKILITGGAGFIGSKLIEKILNSTSKDFCEIVVVDNLLSQVHGENAEIPLSLKDERVKFFKCDIQDAITINRIVKDCDPELVIHLASETGTGQSQDEIVRYTEVNIMGTAILLNALKAHAPNFKKIILSSSRAVYGEGAWQTVDKKRVMPSSRTREDLNQKKYLPRFEGEFLKNPLASLENDPVSPVSIYASTKLQQEYLVKQYLEGTSAKAILFRFQNVYGPGQSLHNPYTGVLSIFSNQILSGKKLNIFEDGQIGRDFVFVDDVVEAVFLGINKELPHGILINIGSGVSTTILDAARTLLKIYNRSINDLSITGDFRIGDIRHALSDNTKANQFLGWKAQVTFEQGAQMLAKSILMNSFKNS